MLTVVFCPCHNDVTFKIKLESTYFLFSYEKQTKSKVLQKCRKDCLTPGANTDTQPMHHIQHGGARGVIVIAVGNEHGDTTSNPGRD